MKPDQFKILWATAPERLEADRERLAALQEEDVLTFAAIAAAPSDLQGQDTAVVLLTPPALDLEEEGKALQNALLAAGVPTTTATRANLAEDGPAAWERRRARLITYALDAARQTTASKENAATLARLSLGDVLEEFNDLERKDPPLYPTGLDALDKVLRGGLREGVYILQGIPGGGKTALALYIAANIVKANPEARVLFHSLEMSRRQVAARVLARLAFDLAEPYAKGTPYSWEYFADTHAPKEWDWQTPSRLRALAAEDIGDRIQNAAIDEFTSISSRFMVAYRGAFSEEEGGEPSVDRLAYLGKVAASVKARDEDGNLVPLPAPVVFVDYLQLIAPPEDIRERRDAVAYNSSMLEKMAHDLRTPVVVLSSMNRAAVNAAKEGKAVAFAAKESGDIDYNADAILSLVDVLDGEGPGAKPLTLEGEDETEHRKGKVVEVQVVKNRTGPATFKGNHPRFDWLTAWGVYQATRHPAEEKAVDVANLAANLAGLRGKGKR